MKNFEQFLLESTKDLRKYLKNKYSNFIEEYGFFKIKDGKPEKIKELLLKKYYADIMKIDIEKDDLLIFKNDAKYDCIMLYAKVTKEWDYFLDEIDKNDIYEDPKGIEEYGLEKNPHLTLIYGIHSTENNPDDIIDVIKKYKPISLEAEEIGIFETDKYDVVKIDIKPSKELLKHRAELLESTINTQTYKDFLPHMTISYVKKGTAKKYIKKLKEKTIFNFDSIVYSDNNYKKKKIILEK